MVGGSACQGGAGEKGVVNVENEEIHAHAHASVRHAHAHASEKKRFMGMHMGFRGHPPYTFQVSMRRMCSYHAVTRS